MDKQANCLLSDGVGMVRRYHCPHAHACVHARGRGSTPGSYFLLAISGVNVPFTTCFRNQVPTSPLWIPTSHLLYLFCHFPATLASIFPLPAPRVTPTLPLLYNTYLAFRTGRHPVTGGRVTECRGLGWTGPVYGQRFWKNLIAYA